VNALLVQVSRRLDEHEAAVDRRVTVRVGEQLEARVVRDGQIRRIDASQLVPGDIVVLGSGDKVPADIELVKEWYLPHLERMHDDAQVRAADVEQLAALAGGYLLVIYVSHIRGNAQALALGGVGAFAFAWSARALRKMPRILIFMYTPRIHIHRNAVT
jgi:hypothetical protein